MRARLATSLTIGAAVALFLAPAAFADSTTATSGGGANVSIITGSNGGTTIVVDSNKPCRLAQGASRSAGRHASAAPSSTINTGPGGLSGSTTTGPGGPSVSIQSGSGSSGGSVSMGSSGGSVTTNGTTTVNEAAPGQCVIVLNAPK